MKNVIIEMIKNRATRLSTWAGLIVRAASVLGYSFAENSDAVQEIAQPIAAAVAIVEVARNG